MPYALYQSQQSKTGNNIMRSKVGFKKKSWASVKSQMSNYNQTDILNGDADDDHQHRREDDDEHDADKRNGWRIQVVFCQNKVKGENSLGLLLVPAYACAHE